MSVIWFILCPLGLNSKILFNFNGGKKLCMILVGHTVIVWESLSESEFNSETVWGGGKTERERENVPCEHIEDIFKCKSLVGTRDNFAPQGTFSNV